MIKQPEILKIVDSINPKKVLVIGASGFMGKKLFAVGKKLDDVRVCGTSFSNNDKEFLTLDVRDPDLVKAVLNKVLPDVVIYATGVANVDIAEKERGLADTLNAYAIKNVAKFFQGHFIYLSTHYVFDGMDPPYSENNERNSVNHYGQSKIRGEDLTKKLFQNYSIVRLDTLYGYNNWQDRETFVTQVIHSLSIDKPLYLDNEMGRSPILIDEVAKYVFDLIKDERQGIFQLAAEISITKYAWAKLIAEEFDYDAKLIHSLQDHPEQSSSITKRAKDPRMTSSYKMSGVKEGLKKMHEQMVKETKQRFEDDMEYFDTDGNYLGRKSRSDIHRNGNWHMAVQAFIVRKGTRGQLQVLSQHRRVVDIAKRKWDHSVAVQMLPEDERNPLKGIQRGLKLELGIDENNIKQIGLASSDIVMRSSRKYGDEPEDLHNREFVFVAIVALNDNVEVRPHPIKIEKIKWIDWNELVAAVLTDAAHYTKNLRHNFVNTALAEHIKRFAGKSVGIKEKDVKKEDRLTGSAYYSPPNNEDLVLSVFDSGKTKIEHLTASGQIECRYLENEDRKIIDGLLKQPNLIPQYVYDKDIFDIDPKMIPASL